MKKITLFIIGFQAKSPGKLVLEKCERFQESILKGQVRKGDHRICGQLLHNSLMD